MSRHIDLRDDADEACLGVPGGGGEEEGYLTYISNGNGGALAYLGGERKKESHTYSHTCIRYTAHSTPHTAHST